MSTSIATKADCAGACRILDRGHHLLPDERRRLRELWWDKSYVASIQVPSNNSFTAVCEHVPTAIYDKVCKASKGLPGDYSWDPIWETCLAVLTRAYISTEDYAILVAPWESVMGAISDMA